MESETLEQFDDSRCHTFGWCTDSGAERGIADQTVRIVPAYRDKYRPGDPRIYFWPWVLFIPGHLHVLFNALEESAKSLDIADNCFDNLGDVIGFLNDRELVRKFRYDCLPPEEQAHFSVGATEHLDWRWEFLCAAIMAVLSRWALLVRWFNIDTLAKSESGRLDRKILRSVEAILKDRLFPLHCEMFLLVGRVVEQFASRLEGCECHAEIWKKTTNVGSQTG